MLQHLFRSSALPLVVVAGLGMAEPAWGQLRGSIGQVVPSAPNFYAPSSAMFSSLATTYALPERPFKFAISYPESFSTRSGITAGAYDPTSAARRSYYGPTAVGPAGVSPAAGSTERGAEIDVRLPAAAELWFDGLRTSQTGAYREFLSPPLSPGRDYTYQVRANWKEGDREVSRTRRVRVRAGDRIDVDFLPPVTERREAVVPVKPIPQ